MYSCKTCEKSFKSSRALQGHQRVHAKNYKDVQNQHSTRLVQRNKQKREERIQQYLVNPIYCLNCHDELPYEKTIKIKNPRYCGRSCATSYANKKRGPRSDETRKKISETANKRNGKPFISTINGPYSKIFYCKCAHCKIDFINRRKIKYCSEHSDLYKRNNRNKYAFTFSIGNHPDLFQNSSLLLKRHGMWSPTNTQGVTRDHRISVNEAIKNNYDPYYITHPLNCELMPWDQNNKKNTKSSLTYRELGSLVDKYELAVQAGIEPASSFSGAI